MLKLAIIGASYLQEPLIQKAKLRNIETHVFAWAVGDVGEKSADYFYPISITEKEQILDMCKEIGIDGICSIASDLAVSTVNYVAGKMGLIGNSMESTRVSTNKHLMRLCFEQNGDPSPKSMQVQSVDDIDLSTISYPVIVKPVDRSGSRGITKVEQKEDLERAIENAKQQGFEKYALVEAFVEGDEYSVEYISFEGHHQFLSVTKKYTTGSPDFIEIAHLEPSLLSDEVVGKVQQVIEHALDSLQIKYGASHSEFKVSKDGSIKIIEIGARMGGDCIGSSLVELSTGFDYAGAVIDISLGIKPDVVIDKKGYATSRFIFSERDREQLEVIKAENPELIVCEDVKTITEEKVTDSGTRFGYYVLKARDLEGIIKYMPR